MTRKKREIIIYLWLNLTVVLICSAKCDLDSTEDYEEHCICIDCNCKDQVKLPTPPGSPKTLVSAGKRITSSHSNASGLINGDYGDSNVWAASELPAWVAIEVGGGICELLLLWTSSNNWNHVQVDWGAPISYRIETSADSTNGSNGTWTVAKNVDNNTFSKRSHRIHFCGQRWVRFTVLSDSGSPHHTRLHQIELHDNSNGEIDGWLFFGDSITEQAFTRIAPKLPAFATLMWEADPDHYPMQINGGQAGDSATRALPRLKHTLDTLDGINVVALCLGTNDLSATTEGRERYRSAMRELITEVQSRGKIAIIPRVPWSLVTYLNTQQKEMFVQIIDDLRQEFALPAGPDLFDFFRTNTQYFTDESHFFPEGSKEINRLWAEAAGRFQKDLLYFQ